MTYIPAIDIRITRSTKSEVKSLSSPILPLNKTIIATNTDE